MFPDDRRALSSRMRILTTIAILAVASPGVPVLHPHVETLGEAPADVGGEAALSPNGRLIAYGIGSDEGIGIWNTATHEHFTLVSGPVHVHHWAPSGGMIVFQAHRGPLSFDGKELTREAAVWTIRVDSSSGRALEPPRLVTNAPVNHGVALSPDERTVAFARYEGSYVSSLCVAPVAGGSANILASGIEVSGVRWSADGKWIFYGSHVTATSKTRTRYRVAASGGVPVAIAEEEPAPVDVADNVWGVDDRATGRLIAYSAFPADVAVSDWAGLSGWPGRRELIGIRQKNARALKIISLADGAARNLIDSTAEIIDGPEWFAGDRIAAIVREEHKLVLLTQSVDGGGVRRYALAHNGAASNLRISPDARYAAFETGAGGYGLIDVLDLSSGRERTIATSPDDFGGGSAPEGAGLGQLAWRADSRAIVYIADAFSGTPTVHEKTLTGVDRVLRPLPRFIYGEGRTSLEPLAPVASPKFVEITGGRDRNGMGSVLLIPIADAPARVVLAEPAFGEPISPDGRTAVIHTGAPPNRISLALASSDGTSERTLSLPFLPQFGSRWLPDSRHLLVLARDRPGAAIDLYSIDTQSDSVRRILPLGTSRNGAAIAASPDGRYAAAVVPGPVTKEFVKLVYDR